MDLIPSKSLSKFIGNSILTVNNCTLSSALGVVEPASICFDLSLETDQMTTYTETRIVSGKGEVGGIDDVCPV